MFKSKVTKGFNRPSASSTLSHQHAIPGWSAYYNWQTYLQRYVIITPSSQSAFGFTFCAVNSVDLEEQQVSTIMVLHGALSKLWNSLVLFLLNSTLPSHRFSVYKAMCSRIASYFALSFGIKNFDTLLKCRWGLFVILTESFVTYHCWNNWSFSFLHNKTIHKEIMIQ